MKTLPFRHEMINGKGSPDCIDFRRAVPEDMDKVMALQDAMRKPCLTRICMQHSTREETHAA